MAEWRKYYKESKARLNGEAIALSQIGSRFIYPAVIAGQFGIANAIKENDAVITNDNLRYLAIGMYMLATVTAAFFEKKTLDKQKISASTGANIVYAATGSSKKAAYVAPFLSIASNIATNPANWAALIGSGMEGNDRFIFANVAALSTTSYAWSVLNNTLIYTGLAEPVLKGLRIVGQGITRPAKYVVNKSKKLVHKNDSES